MPTTNYVDFCLHFIRNNEEISVAALPYKVSIPYGILDLDDRNIKWLYITMTSYFSDKIRVVSLAAIIVVLYIHTGFQGSVYQGKPVLNSITIYIKDGAGLWAVATFFAISGYLFFYNCSSLNILYDKMRRRSKSLLLPYIIAAPFFPLFFIAISQIPSVSSLLGNNSTYLEQIKALPLIGILNNVYLDSGGGYPWAFHLWFIRDLIFIIILTPILYYLKNQLKEWTIIIVLALYIVFPYISLFYSLIWFTIGALFLNKVSKIPLNVAVLLLVSFILLSTIPIVDKSNCWVYIKIPVVLMGVISIWRLYDYFIPSDFQLKDHNKLTFLCGFTFFIYLYHEPFYHIIVRGFPFILGKNEITYLIILFISPFIFIPIIVSAGYFMANYIPRFYKIIVGGR